MCVCVCWYLVPYASYNIMLALSLSFSLAHRSYIIFIHEMCLYKWKLGAINMRQHPLLKYIVAHKLNDTPNTHTDKLTQHARIQPLATYSHGPRKYTKCLIYGRFISEPVVSGHPENGWKIAGDIIFPYNMCDEMCENMHSVCVCMDPNHAGSTARLNDKYKNASTTHAWIKKMNNEMLD